MAKDTIRRKIIRIRHYKFHNKPIGFNNGKPCVWTTEFEDTYFKTFYYSENNELIVEHDEDYMKGAMFWNKNDMIECRGTMYDIDDIVSLLENNFKPKKDFYIKAVNCETTIG